MTRHIVRIRRPWLRVPLWSVWFPVPACRIILAALVSYPHRLVAVDFWRFMAAAYIVGIDGVEA